jgi:hypothetical protein
MDPFVGAERRRGSQANMMSTVSVKRPVARHRRHTDVAGGQRAPEC